MGQSNYIAYEQAHKLVKLKEMSGNNFKQSFLLPSWASAMKGTLPRTMMKSWTLLNIFDLLGEQLSAPETRWIPILIKAFRGRRELRSLQKTLWYSKYSFNCYSLQGKVFPDDNCTAKENGVESEIFSLAKGWEHV